MSNMCLISIDNLYDNFIPNLNKMCIVANEVEDVSNTKIISFNVGYSYDNGKTVTPSQLVIYGADIDNISKSNALILPVYNPSHDTNLIIPLDLSKVPDIFESVGDIYKRWKLVEPTYSMNSKSFSANDSEKGYLSVKKAGDYKFSILNYASDFDRINPNELTINKHAKISVDMHTNEYSFIVYQFSGVGNVEIAPFGYLCQLGQSGKSDSMIIPTIHGHPHVSADPSSFFNRIPDFRFNAKNEFEQMSDFNHKIYVLCKSTEYGRMQSYGVIPNKTDATDLKHLLKTINTDYMGLQITIYPPIIFTPRLLKLDGKLANRNIKIDGEFGHSFLYDLNCDKMRNMQN